ncbi:Winged helix DNA-binding domain-containing protein [Nocardiopsis flavescens]|uniref:Winged helix DNA-binding domain-containing protein n=1 Tax=Nocardiopsis flavescens TaxID=758803 RepID=A0A1M6NQW6_9ACTN|nr:winged helix DNA-binding domain-containing protein [Nocardiopsis flavescens]SHJ98141.1 Winged helix DNA-binding domain-containing protein [Nocardiopsis flavescens]
MTVLDDRALNRAALARQALLAPSDRSALDLVSHLCGLQAQEPQEPFVGLWTRMRGFEASELSDLLTGRRVVRVHLMRRTVHLVATEDALAWRSRFGAMLRQKVAATYRRELEGVDLDELDAAGRAVLADGEPRTMAELVEAVADRWPGTYRRALGEMLVSALIPVVQTPPRGLWRTRGGVRNAPLEAWTGRGPAPHDPDGTDPVGRALVRRYLAAYGPATSTDLRSWCGLAGLPAAVAAVRGELVSFRDAHGRELLDLPGAPRPDPGTPAPVRFLPAFDNAVLGYHHRGRIIDDAHRGLSVEGARMVLVDGRVAATWTAADGTVSVAPLRPFTGAERDAVAAGAEDLSAFLSDGGSRRVRIDG